LFQAFWQSRTPVSAVAAFARWRPIALTNTNDVAGALPDDFVAASFHFNEAFPDTEANRRFVINLLNSLADTSDVVLLTPAAAIDHHAQLSVAARGRIHDVARLLSPRTNLDAQTKVIARARAFVGTHGGLSYLPPLVGVKSISFFSTPTPGLARHLEVARRAFAAMAPGGYVALDVTDLEALRAGLGASHETVAALARARLS
jgi:hypothetical protein